MGFGKKVCIMAFNYDFCWMIMPGRTNTVCMLTFERNASTPSTILCFQEFSDGRYYHTVFCEILCGLWHAHVKRNMHMWRGAEASEILFQSPESDF